MTLMYLFPFNLPYQLAEDICSEGVGGEETNRVDLHALETKQSKLQGSSKVIERVIVPLIIEEDKEINLSCMNHLSFISKPPGSYVNRENLSPCLKGHHGIQDYKLNFLMPMSSCSRNISNYDAEKRFHYTNTIQIQNYWFQWACYNAPLGNGFHLLLGNMSQLQLLARRQIQTYLRLLRPHENMI